MAKLYFRYGAMNSGKSTALMQVAYNYEEKGRKVIVIKPAIDTKGEETLVSRIGLERKADLLLSSNDKVRDYLEGLNGISCILVDEVQFLTSEQITELWEISKIEDIPVICYGLRMDFKTNAFLGSARLFELADELEELITICECGKRAKFNARKENGQFVTSGAQVVIDGTANVSYVPLCGKCYLKEVLKKGK